MKKIRFLDDPLIDSSPNYDGFRAAAFPPFLFQRYASTFHYPHDWYTYRTLKTYEFFNISSFYFIVSGFSYDCIIASISSSSTNLPITVHYALSNGASPAIVDCILKQRPNSARGFDKRGWTPLHVACGVGADMYVIKAIVDSYPEAVLMRTNKGSTAKQCLSLTNAANKSEVKRMLQDTFARVEERYRPAQVPKSERVLV